MRGRTEAEGEFVDVEYSMRVAPVLPFCERIIINSLARRRDLLSMS